MTNKRVLVGIGTILALTLSAAAGFSQGQAAQNRIPQQIIVNGQTANGAYVTAPGGGLQSFTCTAPAQYSTADGATQGWACFEQSTGTWLLNALPPAQQQAQPQEQAPLPAPAQPQPQAAPAPAPLPQQGAPLPAPPVPAPAPYPQAAPLPAQAPLPAAYPPQELDRIASPIALYPDPLLAQVLTASTFWTEIPDAALWADQHHYLTGPALTSAMAADQVPWDPSVQALVPFPSVLDMMASAMPWTQELGSAFLAEPNAVMDAVQRERQIAVRYGYLRPGPQMMIRTGPYVEIMPVSPNYIVVPYYDPLVVFAPPRPGIVVGGAVRLGFGVTLGAVWTPWGWGTSRFVWGTHTLVINNGPWGRTWVNRVTYVHPFNVPRYTGSRPAEGHRIQERTREERVASRGGGRPREGHRDEHR